MLKQVWEFLKNPAYIEEPNTDYKYRLIVLFKILLFSLSISILLAMLIGILETVFKINFGKHAIDTFINEFPLVYLFVGAIILAPVLEELVFRGPLILFKNKTYFKFVFYIVTLVFGFIHITNFELTPTILFLSPILVAPQLVVGSFLGFVRVKFGLIWSIALHACYNLILIGPVIILKMLNIPLQ